MTGDTQLFDMGYTATKQPLELEQRPTAIFALTGPTAIGVLHADCRISEDSSVMGYDDLPMAAFTIPPLTTIAQPLIEMGETAVRLLKQIENEDFLPERAVLPTRLVIRSSTAPPPQRG